jgi:hypothetical protein
MLYVLSETNVPGGERYEVDAYEIDGDMEFHNLNEDPGSDPTTMPIEQFNEIYEPGDTPPHARHADPVPSPPMV